MRKGLTLIELIFSMVIIAIVFTIVPKIIFASNKSMELSMKEDALYNAYSLLGSILRLSWDENTTTAGKILDTGEHNCSDYRVGGFIGSRNCVDSDDSATKIGLEDSDYNDIDDYDGYDENISVAGRNKYKISVDVNYVQYDNPNFSHQSETDTKEYKEINVTVEAHIDNKKMIGYKSGFFYHSANLGQIYIKKQKWK